MDTLEQVRDHLLQARGQGRKETELEVSETLMEWLRKDKYASLRRMVALSGYLPNCTISRRDMRLHLKELEVCKGPSFFINNVKDMLNVLQTAKEKDLKTFQLVMLPELFSYFMEDKGKKFHLLCHRLCDTKSDYSYYSEFGVLNMKEFSCDRNAHFLTSLQEIQREVEWRTKRLQLEFHLYMLPELEDQFLMEHARDDDLKPIASILYQAGVLHYGCEYWSGEGHMRLYNLQYYPGFGILQTVRAHKEANLTSRQKETLMAARKLIHEIPKESPEQFYVDLAQRLGREIVYTINDRSEEDDCAIGALVDRKANCDGYADAFYLCAGLCGLEVRYVFGDARKPSQEKPHAFHMWNQVKVRGGWTMLDATWCAKDGMGGTDGRYLLIGEDRTEKYYRWDKRFSQMLVQVTDPGRLRDVCEYVCRNREEVHAAIRDARKRKTRKFRVFQGENGITEFNQMVEILRKAGFSGSYQGSFDEQDNSWLIEIQR